MKQVLLFGAGKSATVLIDYLLKNAATENWNIKVVDADLRLAETKIKGSPYAKALSFDIINDDERKKNIWQADIVISLLPPTLHFLVAQDCLEFEKNLLTASYVDDNIKSLEDKIKQKNILFLCEMGLDPGIDHMSAMKLIENIRIGGGKITSFQSHCGGLVAPESDDNPWHYKISWNPHNVVMAGKAGATFKEDGEEIHLKYEELFSSKRTIDIPEMGYLSWYPNRDSLSYVPLYGLQTADTFIRTTIRHPDFIYGWKNVIDLKLTDETPQYETDGKVLSVFFKEHMDKYNFGDWLQQKLMERVTQTKDLLENLMNLLEDEQEAEETETLMMIDEKGEMANLEIDEVKSKAASVVAHKMHEASLMLKQLFFLGMDDDKTRINKGFCSAADVLQLALEKKLALQPEDKDMIIMLHEIKYEAGSKKNEIKSCLIVKGDDNVHTAMAKTVGLPLGIAAKLILNGKINLKGLHIPTKKEIYDPVLEELEKYEIKFFEEIMLMD